MYKWDCLLLAAGTFPNFPIIFGSTTYVGSKVIIMVRRLWKSDGEGDCDGDGDRDHDDDCDGDNDGDGDGDNDGDGVGDGDGDGDSG